MYENYNDVLYRTCVYNLKIKLNQWKKIVEYKETNLILANFH
jgi:hypothetical protein